MDGEVFETKRCGKVDSRERDVILRSAVDGAVGERNNGTVLEELALDRVHVEVPLGWILRGCDGSLFVLSSWGSEHGTDGGKAERQDSGDVHAEAGL